MLNKIINAFRNNERIHKILDLSLVIFLGLYIFSIPSFSARNTWNYVSYFLMSASAFLTVLEYFLYEKFYFDKRLLIFVVFIFEALLGTALFSHDFRHWLTMILVFLSLVIFYYAFNVIKDKRAILKLIAFAFLAFGAYFAFVYRNRVLSLRFSGSALGSYFDNPNTIGTYFSIGCALFLYLALFRKKRIELIYIVPSLGMLYLGLFTGSRHFIITTFVAAFVVVLLSFKKRKWIALIILIILAVLFFAAIQLPALADLKERIDRGLTTLFGIGHAKIDPSAVQRTLWPQYGFYLGSKQLIFGYGVEGFAKYSGIGAYAHNNYAEVFCNFGIIGLALFYTILLYPLILSLRNKRRDTYIVIVIIAFYLAKGFFGVFCSSKDSYILFALCFWFVRDIHLGGFKKSLFDRECSNYDYSEVSI